MGKPKILIVEDEAIVAMDLEVSLKKLGYIVTSVVDSNEAAIEKTQIDQPDIVLMAINFKGMMDITDRKKAEDVLHRSREQFRALSKVSFEAILFKRVEPIYCSLPFAITSIP